MAYASRRESRFKPISAGEAMERLVDTCKLIQYREGVRPHEAKRMKDAFTLMAAPSVEEESQTAVRRNSYRRLLKKVQDAVGPQIVVLCAVGLGQSTIGATRDRVQLEFLAPHVGYQIIAGVRCLFLMRLTEVFN